MTKMEVSRSDLHCRKLSLPTIGRINFRSDKTHDKGDRSDKLRREFM